MYHVPSLTLPTAGRWQLTDWLMEFESIRLFVERAGAVNTAFALTEQNATAVLEICQRLDGIPLALELAAARCKLLSPEQIAERLHDRFALLTQGSRTAMPRQQTLRGTIDWSHNLLSRMERNLFRRVSVFAGGFTLDAAQAVCGGAGISQFQVLDGLSQLVDKSLIIVQAHGVETRYRLLDTIRQYAVEKLQDASETQSLRERHRDYFIALAEQAEPKLKGGEQFLWLDRLEVEHDNLRAAWSSAIEGDADLALRLTSALLDFWLMRGSPSEGREWSAKLIARTKGWGQTAQSAQMLNVAGRLAHFQADYPAACSLLDQALSVGRAAGDKKNIAFALLWLGRTALHQGDVPRAQALIEEGFTIYQELQDEWGIARALRQLGELAGTHKDQITSEEFFLRVLAKYRDLGDRFNAGEVLNALGEVARFQGDYDRAGSFYSQALEIFRELRSRFPQAHPLFNLAWVSLHWGDYRNARDLFDASLKLKQEYGHTIGIVECLGGLAAILGMTGKPEQAARLFSSVESLTETIGIAGHFEPTDQQELDHYLEVVRAKLDPAAFAQAWAEGRAWTLEQAIDYALEKTRL